MKTEQTSIPASVGAIRRVFSLGTVEGIRLQGMGTQLFSRIDGTIHAIMDPPPLPLPARSRRIGLIPS